MKFSIQIILIIASITFAVAGSVRSQGNIFGSVTRADLSVPDSGDVVFFGFVNDTDDELRISSSVGAGYDNGNWFDDFQNYSSLAAGLPYDYYFFDLSTQQGVHLAEIVPTNSFQQEDIQLSPLSWPASVTTLTAIRTSSNYVKISWPFISGFSYHIYRRASGSDGSLFRIDDPSGKLDQPGITDSQFIDVDAPEPGLYDYVVITSAGADSYSPPSDIATSSSPNSCCFDFTGNIDQADGTDITDLTFLIDHLFITLLDLPECPRAYNTPPVTQIIGFDPNTDFIKSLVSGRGGSVVSANWKAEDPVDFPLLTPSFEFNWKIYGPYFDDSSGANRWDTIKSQFVKTVFVLKTGEVLQFGRAHTFIVCDTIPVPFGIDSVVLLITCDTVLVDTVQSSNVYGTIDTLFDVNDPVFKFSNDNRVALSSWNGIDEWITDTTDTFYDLFGMSPSDTTIAATFVLWVQARDPVDSLVVDLTPDFVSFSVIDPKYERDVAVIDFQTAFIVNGITIDSARTYWQQAIDNWRPNTGYEDSRDYWRVSQSIGSVLPLEYILSYKVIILLSDDSKSGLLIHFLDRVFAAQLAGVGTWLMMRNPLFGGEGMNGDFTRIIPSDYPEQFGVVDMVYSGWDWYARVASPPLRIEDFIGATSTQPQLWSDLAIDTSRLHSRYKWTTFPLIWVDSLGALPEVNYVVPVSGAEVMYTYNSLYGPNHFLGEKLSFHDRPVAIRWETSRFRSAHWLFTPYAFEEAAIQPVIDSMLNWLMGSWLSGEGQ